VYPWASLPAGARVVDVAGGVGQASMEIGRAHPHLHFIIQDLPGTIEVAKQVITLSIIIRSIEFILDKSGLSSTQKQ